MLSCLSSLQNISRPWHKDSIAHPLWESYTSPQNFGVQSHSVAAARAPCKPARTGHA
jgi:hypothetical protein